MTLCVGTVDGTEGQSSLFRISIISELERRGLATVRHVVTGSATTLIGVDIVFIFTNSAEDASSSYQKEWATAAKEAGVKLFVPFEFGNPMGTLPGDPGFTAAIPDLLDHCSSIGLPVCRFLSGPAMDVMLPGILGVEPIARTARVIGNGDTLISFATTTDVGRAVAAALEPPANLDSLSGRTFRIMGSPHTLKVVALLANIEGEPITIVQVPIDQAKTTEPPVTFQAFVDWVMVGWEEGRFHIDNPTELPGVEFESVESVLKRNINNPPTGPPPA